MAQREASWGSFKDAVRAIIERHKDFFGLRSVEPETGAAFGKSGYTWDIEIVGYTKNEHKLVLFECRRKTTRNLPPDDADELAYRIEDTGADKGFFVTTLGRGLSEGVKASADHEAIGHIQVSADATPEQYVMRHLNQVFAGLTTTVGIRQRTS
jgi:hypothetical protein